MLHPIVRWLCRRSIRWFYREAQFVNAGAIPESGATLIVASHGNDLPDILMTFLATNRDVLFVANIAAADSPLVRWTYQGLGVIPVSRVRDARALRKRGEDAVALNAQAFVRVVDALKDGHAVAIFPEGNVNALPHLGRLRSGAAKMALQALEAGVQSLTLVPIGYQYESPSTPRSGLLGVVGRPTRLEEWRPDDPAKPVTELTQFIRDELQSVTRNARASRDAEVLSAIAAATGAVLSTPAVAPIVAAHDVQRRLSAHSAADAVFVAESVAPRSMTHATSIQEFEAAALRLSASCTAFGASAWSARDHADVLCAAGDNTVANNSPRAAAVLALAPIAMLAWAWHAIPIWASRTLAVRYAPSHVDIAARTILPGLYFMEVWYLLVPLVLLLAGVPPFLVLVLFIIQPRLGDFAFSWSDRYRTMRLMRRVRTAPADSRQSLVQDARLLRERWRGIAGSGGK